MKQLKTQSPVHALSASRRFEKYKREEKQELRQPAVKGDELEQLRRREMLRSMPPEEAFQLIEFHKYLNFFEALALAKKENKLIVPNFVHDRILTETSAEYRVWTGTGVIYEAPDKAFGEKVVYSWDDKWVQYSISFDVPARFQGKKDCCLVVEHPDFEIVSLGNNTFELKASEGMSLLEKFPQKNSRWYGYDERFRIPVSDPVRKGKKSRFLARVVDSCISLVARDCLNYGDDFNRPYVYLNVAPSDAYGVAVF